MTYCDMKFIIFIHKIYAIFAKYFKKNLNKTFMAKATGPFRDSQAPSWLSGPGPMYPPLIGPGNAM